MDNRHFLKELKVKSNLKNIIEKDFCTMGEALKLVWKYIKKNNLQDPKNKKNIIADENLIKIFEGKKIIRMFDLSIFISKEMND